MYVCHYYFGRRWKIRKGVTTALFIEFFFFFTAYPCHPCVPGTAHRLSRSPNTLFTEERCEYALKTADFSWYRLSLFCSTGPCLLTSSQNTVYIQTGPVKLFIRTRLYLSWFQSVCRGITSNLICNLTTYTLLNYAFKFLYLQSVYRDSGRVTAAFFILLYRFIRGKCALRYPWPYYFIKALV